MKQFVILVTCICTMFSLFCSNISVQANQLEENDIMSYVISGSGTIDDPYIFSGEENFYTVMFEKNLISKISFQNKEKSNFNGVFNGTVYYNQFDGGVWKRTSGGPSTTANNALRLERVIWSADLIMMDIVYNTSYNGSWYQSSSTVDWEIYPTVILPGSYYGIGYYTTY